MKDNFEQQYYKTRNPVSKTKEVIKSHVEEVISSIYPYLKKPLKEVSVLDVGSGQGEYSFELAKHVKKVVGVEPYREPYEVSILGNMRSRSKIEFYNVPIEKFRSKEKFDLVLCLTVIEHMPNAEKSFQQIFKLLKRGGVIYLTAPNRLWPVESHYKLLFLSWLPAPLANLYMRLSGRGKSYTDSAYSKTYFGMRAFFEQFPCEYKFVLPKNIEGSFMGCGSSGPLHKMLVKIGVFLIREVPLFWVFSKGFIMIIQKRAFLSKPL